MTVKGRPVYAFNVLFLQRKRCVEGCELVLEVPAVLDLIPGPNDLLQTVLVGPVAAVHIRMKDLNQTFVSFPDLGLRPVILGLQDIDRAPFRRR